MHLFGSFGVKLDFEKAYHYLSEAAEQEHPKATAHLGYMYQKGYFVEKNMDTAIEYYKESINLVSIFFKNNNKFILN